MTALAIPARLAHRPVQGGRIVPWIALELPDGTYDLRGCRASLVDACFRRALCQVCGQHITPPLVFFAADDQLDDLVLDSPPVHPECAAYSAHACPMLAGQLATYSGRESRASRIQECLEPGCNCGGYEQLTGQDRGAAPAPTWSMVWTRRYEVAVDRASGQAWGARIVDPLKIRPVRVVGVAAPTPTRSP